MKEDIYVPEYLNIEDHILANSLKIGASRKASEEKGRSYRLYSIIEHRGNEIARGHYINYTLDADNHWIAYDDDK